jgi:pSer/pThr/pTyr-binding forkhead associated (FHA) protein
VSTLTLTLIQLGFVAVLWIFVLVTVSVMRSDLFGVRVRAQAAPKAPKPQGQPKPARASKAPRPARPARQGRGEPGSLAVLEGPLAGQTIPLTGPIAVGRGPDNTVVLQDDYVSSRHARFYNHDGRWYVEDMGSTNGTQVGGSRITNPAQLHLGTTIKMGKTVLEVRK